MKDVNVELNTQNSGEAECITPIIKGEILGIIIFAESPLGVNISFEEDEKIVLYNNVQFVGTQYLPLGTEPVYKDGDKNKDRLVNWCLNNKLRIRVKGKMHTSIKFTIRYKEI